jgi:hypothetical protein
MKDEFKSIYRLAKGANSRIASCNRLIGILSKKRNFSRNDLVKINFIAEQIKKDKLLKEVVLNKLYISNSKRKVIGKIKRALNESLVV